MYAHLDPLIDQIETPEWQEKADSSWVDDLKHLSWKELCHVITRGYADGHEVDMLEDCFLLEDIYDFCRRPHPYVVRQTATHIRTHGVECMGARAQASTAGMMDDANFQEVLEAVASHANTQLEFVYPRDGAWGVEQDHDSLTRLLQGPRNGWGSTDVRIFCRGSTINWKRLFEDVDPSGVEECVDWAPDGGKILAALAPFATHPQSVSAAARYVAHSIEFGVSEFERSCFISVRPNTSATIFLPRVVDLDGQDIHGEPIATLYEILENPRCQLVHLSLHKAKATNREHRALWDLIGSCKSLKTLVSHKGYLSSCLPALIANTSLEEVTLKAADIEDIDFTETPQDFALQVKFEDEDLVSWLAAVAQRPRFRKLSIEGCASRGTPVLHSLGAALTGLFSHPRLEMLAVTDRARGFNAPMKFTALANNTALKSLQLLGFQWTLSDWDDLTRALVCNAVLETLEISLRGFDEAMSRCLSKMMPLNKSLTTIKLVGYRGGQASAIKLPWQESFLKALGRNSSLKEFCWEEQFNDNMYPAVLGVLDANYTLEKFKFGMNGGHGVPFREVNRDFNRKLVQTRSRVSDWLESMPEVTTLEAVYYLVRSQPEWIGRLASADGRSRKRCAGELNVTE